jgi:hypothetical protein
MSYLFFLSTYDSNDFVPRPVFPSGGTRSWTPDEPRDATIDADLCRVALPSGFMSRMSELARTLPNDVG